MKYRDSARSMRSAELYQTACVPIPAGVNSTARARWSGWDPYPLFVDRGDGAYLFDVDGNEYIDYLLLDDGRCDLRWSVPENHGS